ncbi:hypothetical protein I79_001857 [Cricetulus griseus]|uniref:Uncharacterized protein n=1 Tax=Cricetulus griseus TaxID=10029 RepID=G3GVV4_CRIGR|nr:hypothetical protein I79_001857 [Cricetulus griseus]
MQSNKQQKFPHYRVYWGCIRRSFKYILLDSQAQWYMPLIPALRRHWDLYEFEANLVYIVSSGVIT